MVGTVHGAFEECSNALPGMFVEADHLSTLTFLQKEVFGLVCDVRGVATKPPSDDKNCKCKSLVQGKLCNLCKEGHWNLKQANHEGCEKCTCDPRGAEGGNPCAHQLEGDCRCK